MHQLTIKHGYNQIGMSAHDQGELIMLVSNLLPYVNPGSEIIIPIPEKSEPEDEQDDCLPWDMAGYDVDAVSEGDAAPAEEVEGANE